MGAMAKANPKKQAKKTEAGRDMIRDTNDTMAAVTTYTDSSCLV